MAAYSNYQIPQYGQSAPPGGYGQPQQPQSPYGQPPQQQYPPQQGMGMMGQQQPPAGGGYDPFSSAQPAQPTRAPIRRSLSMGSAQALQNQMAMVSFDPYSSTQNAPAAPAAGSAYTDYASSTPQPGSDPLAAFDSAPPAGGGFPGTPASSMASGPADPWGAPPPGAAAPPAFSTEDMTTTPMTASQFGFAQPPPQAGGGGFDAGMSTVSDVTMFTQSAPPAATAATSPTSTAMVPKPKEDAVLANIDPKLVAEQEKIYADIQARNKMQAIRKNAGISNKQRSNNGGRSHQHHHQQRAMVPYGTPVAGGSGRPGAPPRTRSMPNPGNQNRSQTNSLARGGVAVLDPKKDLRKQTRKMKTAGGAVGGAVVGGLILGPVGVVLGASGGAAVSNKMAKSRDKRKQAEFEQRNFQKGAAQSVAAKSDGSFV